MKKTTKKMFNIFFYIITSIMVLYILVDVFMPKQTMSIFRLKSYIVVTDSMEPDINVGDLIIVRKASQASLKAGDAITFYVYLPELRKKDYVTHYIADIQTNDQGRIIYKTQGAEKEPDDFDRWTDQDRNPIDITYQDIVGKVWIVIPYIGIIVNVLRDPIMLSLIIVNIIIIYFLVKTLKKARKEKHGMGNTH